MTAFQFRVSSYLFTPKLIPSLVTLILFPTLVFLGLWQLDRAEEKREIDNGVSQAIAKPALGLNNHNVLKLNNEIYRKDTINGHYDIKQQLLLDNRTHLGKPGYHVLTPFLFQGINGNYAVLVNRGWISYQGTRDNIPNIELVEDEREIKGTIKAVNRSIVLTETEKQQSTLAVYPRLIQSIEIAELSQELKYKLLPIIIELDKSDQDGFVREWQPYYGSIDKHNAYALQWFVMAAILLFLYIKLNLKKS